MEGVRLSKEELKSRFGISERLAIRVGALRSRGLEVTVAVLEESVRTRAVEDLLLGAGLMEKAGGLTTEVLRGLGPAAAPFGVYGGVLAFEEESLADQVWNAPPGKGQSLSLPANQPHAVLDAADAARLFNPDDVAQMKLTLLTGVDAKLKVEALRKLAFAPMSVEEKGVLTLKALADPDPVVRREAAGALQGLGLSSGLAEALSTLSEGTPRQKILSLQKIETLGPRAGPAERSVTLAFLVSDLGFEADPHVLQGLLAAITGFADLLSPGGDPLATLVRRLLKLLADHFDALAPGASRLLGEIARGAGPAVSEALWKEIEGVSDRRIKFFFEHVLCTTPLETDFRRRLATTIATDLADATTEDMSSRRLADSFTSLGNDALLALLEIYPKTAEDRRPLLLSVMDTVATSSFVDDEAREKAGELLLQALREGGRAVRAHIMELNLCSHERLSSKIKRELALDFVGNLHGVKAARIQELTHSTLRRMGAGIVDALKQTVQKSPHRVERDAAAAALAEVAGGLREVDEFIRFFRRCEEGDTLSPGFAIRAVARLCAGPHASADLVNEAYKDYAGRTTEGFDRVAALGWIASSPACDAAVAGDTLLKLADLLESDFPAPEVRETKTEEGTMLVVGAETAVYTELLPDIIEGLRRIVLSGRVPPGLRERVLRRMCARFRALAEYEVIWAPGNIVELARALAEIATDGATPGPMRLKIVSALMTNLRNLSTAKVVSQVCSQPEETSPDHAKMVGQIARRLLEMHGHRDYAELEDRRLLVAALGRLAMNRQVGSAKRESDEFKERVVEALLEEADAGFREGRALLQRLASSEALPKALKKRLQSHGGGA